MSIEDIISGLPAELRLRLEHDAERAKRMVGGGHLQDWMDFETSFWGIRTEAMRIAHVNKPKGRGHNEAVGQLMRHYGLDHLDGDSVSATLWLTDTEPETKTKSGDDYLTRREILDGILKSLTPGQRSRLGSPITAQQRVKNKIKELTAGDRAEDGQVEAADGKPRNVPVVPLDQAVGALMHHFENIDLDHKRAIIERIAGPMREDGDTYHPNAPVGAIADALLRTFEGYPNNKGRKIALRWLELLDQRKPKAPGKARQGRVAPGEPAPVNVPTTERKP